ncbi:BlaI/MecI/CopY family transcriptional regulator [Verrucomicrobiales bacterium]|nr:BlaI/MecI/CopY family transcriptional regulator [Verrucomicrobiales bacterium]
MSCVNISTLMETDHLSPRERQIMDALLILGEATARGIQDALPDPLANATVRTMLRILETKGEVQHHEDGRRFVYRPVRSRKSMARTAMKRMVDVFYEGSVTQTVSGLLQLRDTQMSDEEWDELSALLNDARQRQSKKRRSNYLLSFSVRDWLSWWSPFFSVFAYGERLRNICGDFGAECG